VRKVNSRLIEAQESTSVETRHVDRDQQTVTYQTVYLVSAHIMSCSRSIYYAAAGRHNRSHYGSRPSVRPRRRKKTKLVNVLQGKR